MAMTTTRRACLEATPVAAAATTLAALVGRSLAMAVARCSARQIVCVCSGGWTEHGSEATTRPRMCCALMTPRTVSQFTSVVLVLAMAWRSPMVRPPLPPLPASSRRPWWNHLGGSGLGGMPTRARGCLSHDGVHQGAQAFDGHLHDVAWRQKHGRVACETNALGRACQNHRAVQ